MPRIGEILETGLYVDDLDVSVDFYVRVMGLRVATQIDRMAALWANETQVVLLFVKGGSAEPIETPGGVIPPNDGDGQMHVAFAIPSDEVDAWEETLSRHDVALESKVTWEKGGLSLYFRDPDDHSLELQTTAWGGKELVW